MTSLLSGCYDRGGFPLALYDNMHCVLPDPDSNPPRTWLSTHTQIAPIYLKLANGKVYFLPDLTENDMDVIASGSDWDASRPGSFSDRHTSFKFSEGKLVAVTLGNATNRPKSVFEISLNADGPFHPLPTNKEELVAYFGEPIEWKRYHPPPAGP